MNCKKCGNEFTAVAVSGVMPKFCGRACFESGTPQPREKACPICETIFLAKRSSRETADGLRVYCSKKCLYEGMLKGEMRNCPNCGIEFYLKESAKKQRPEDTCCSRNCQNEFHVRENSRAWKGGEYTDNTVGDVRVNFPREGYSSDWIGKHRLVASKAIGRLLRRTEVVLYIDGNRQNTDPKNLFICASFDESRKRQCGTLPWPTESNLDTYEKALTPPRLRRSSGPA